MSKLTVRFEMYGDFVVEAADSLITWGGMGTIADDVQVDGVTVISDMTQEQP